MSEETSARRSIHPSFEPLEPRLMLSGDPVGQDPYFFEFSLDIGSDTELSDPHVNMNEAFDPGDVYLWQGLPVHPPGRDGFKDDEIIFGQDPWPDPPDAGLMTRVPVGEGGIENYEDYFDLDGHDQLDVSLYEQFELPWAVPVPEFASWCIFAPGHLMVSFDDDMAPGWPAGDVPVTAPSPAGLIYGTTAGQDEINGLMLATISTNFYTVVWQYGVADEMTVHQSLAPNPDHGDHDDDDVDSLDIVWDEGACPYWYFSADHEAHFGLDPGDIYEVTPGGPVQVVDDVMNLGLRDDTDVDAFEFVWLVEPDMGLSLLGVLFSVDDNDPLTPNADESGGLNPNMIYGSFLTGYYFAVLDEPLNDDVDALTNWHESLGPDMDWGDAPEPGFVPGYPTTAANNGANHVIGGPWLGDNTDNPDAEPDGQPDPNALGDDNDILYPPANDDEDGVQIPPLVIGMPNVITFEVNSGGIGAGGVVEAWLDWDGSNSWEASEQIVSNWYPDGVHPVTVIPPAGSVLGQTFARFRISANGGLAPDGPAPDGEVEDHEVWIEQPDMDFGDAPDAAGAVGYATLLANNGARHIIGGPWLGDAADNPDAEPDGQPDWNALGDDNDILYPPANDDEDGVLFTTLLVQGSTAGVDVTASGPGILNAWLDYNGNGTFADPGEQIFTDVALVAGTNSLTFPVYLSAAPGQTFARFRFASVGGLSYDGQAPDGEVEDHEVRIDEAPDMFKWYQPPEQANPDNVYYGWNEYSVYGGQWIVADDWVCTTDAAVTDIHWWGSFIGVTDPHDAPFPTAFHIGFWSDVPADPGATDPFSHPGDMVHEIYCDNFISQWVGWDYDPLTGTYEACFQFNQILNPEEYFYQEAFTGEPNQANIYWISISAVYEAGFPDYPWGWKTRPRDLESPAPDDAVRILDPVAPISGDAYVWGEPIEELDISWDMAFELTTTEGVQKWRQDPNIEDTGMDVLAGPFVPDPAGGDYYEKFLADDFECTESGLITKITFWSSYLEDRHLMEPGLLPSFSLAIYSDIPVDESPTGYSMPGHLLWDAYLTATLEQVYVTGVFEQFYDPNQDEIIGEDWTVWQYTFEIPAEKAFNQEGSLEEPITYWLGVHHTFDLDGNGLVDLGDLGMLAQNWPAGFGWKTSLDQWNDDAVWVDVDTFAAGDPHVTPITDMWRELRYPLGHPFEGKSIDLAFALTTEPDKWLQKPDLEPTGMDVYASDNGPDLLVLADDWQCIEVGEIDQIIIWGSWYHDQVPVAGLTDVTFTLSIHDDIPAGQLEEWSVPGNTLWWRNFTPGSYTVSKYAEDLDEGWYDPITGQYDPMGDTVCWIYVFDLAPGEFIQEGKPDDPVIYWLDVQAHYDDSTALFGWKTSLDHWNDDAVYHEGREPVMPGPGVWQELRYPVDHLMAGDSIDLAFKIIGPGAKWSQPPEPYVPDDAFNGWDEYSVYDRNWIVADDFVCASPEPISDVHWWGSFIGWGELEPPQMPDAFHFAIWKDVPVGVDQPWSHPGEVIWDHYCDNFTWEFAGWDFDPRNPMTPPEATFYFEQDIPQDEWFWQQPGENIYWISISAVYPDVDPQYPWGWKTRPHDPAAPDDAVRIFAPTAPLTGMAFVDGEPIFWPTPAESWDMAFALTTADIVPPAVVDVQVKGTVWSVADYSIPVGSAAQYDNALGWGTIDQIEVTFSEDVMVTQADMTLTGLGGPYAFSGFSYDLVNYAATWTLTGNIDTDVLQLTVFDAGQVRDYAGNDLDGEWTDGFSTYPSGNGVAGGDFNFKFKVLPGEANYDRQVDGADYTGWADNYQTFQNYYWFADFTADGYVDGADYTTWADHYMDTVPAGAPAGGSDAGGAAAMAISAEAAVPALLFHVPPTAAAEPAGLLTADLNRLRRSARADDPDSALPGTRVQAWRRWRTDGNGPQAKLGLDDEFDVLGSPELMVL